MLWFFELFLFPIHHKGQDFGRRVGELRWVGLACLPPVVPASPEPADIVSVQNAETKIRGWASLGLWPLHVIHLSNSTDIISWRGNWEDLWCRNLREFSIVCWMGSPALWWGLRSRSLTYLIPFTYIAKITFGESQFLKCERWLFQCSVPF